MNNLDQSEMTHMELVDELTVILDRLRTRSLVSGGWVQQSSRAGEPGDAVPLNPDHLSDVHRMVRCDIA